MRGLSLLLLLAVVFATAVFAEECKQHADCGERGFCWKNNCGNVGVCIEGIPPNIQCPTDANSDSHNAVCGCNGETYDNECIAMQRGIQIRHAGECEDESRKCESNIHCDDSEFCRLESCKQEAGECVQRPQVCTAVFSPVCGCDGETYGNECEADSHGVTVQYEGECKNPGCESHEQCGENRYCYFSQCNSDQNEGVCKTQRQNCAAVYDPVCGCDGKTYSNQCSAAAARVSVKHKGECEGNACRHSGNCGSAQFCMKDCEAETGHCENRPSTCTDTQESTVCTCEGNSYRSPCDAHVHGENVYYQGPCEKRCAKNLDCCYISTDPNEAPDNVHCNQQYCFKEECGGTGVCKSRGDICPAVYEPVCGCDGKTYSNTCDADARGMSVAYEGECETKCEHDEHCCDENSDGTTDCTQNYCAKEQCGGPGVCKRKGDICPKIYDPVCGCDGKTYSNACDADANGMSVAYEGECVMQCEHHSQCCDTATNEKCSLFCSKNQCSGVGTCQKKPDVCPQTIDTEFAPDPFCGCDGNTYQNQCYAAAAGVNVEHPGECKEECNGAEYLSCEDSSTCAKNEYCAGPCGMGRCAVRPEVCPHDISPVCGCDGSTYNNDCEARRQGTEVHTLGSCGPVLGSVVIPLTVVRTRNVFGASTGNRGALAKAENEPKTFCLQADPKDGLRTLFILRADRDLADYDLSKAKIILKICDNAATATKWVIDIANFENSKRVFQQIAATESTGWVEREFSFSNAQRFLSGNMITIRVNFSRTKCSGAQCEQPSICFDFITAELHVPVTAD
eukprot:TRINITY_DN1561_c0_g1_i4.p1 TRINITY_DN1561_c0_g1~~TRINITY_DN1561_c0_g1_i4.p1  ORF type:complete len:793 (-),score=100.42 TRINITY_DN1561_c0_g1_i4:103-2481(-)